MNQERCALCNKALIWLDQHKQVYECSHVDCEHRPNGVTVSGALGQIAQSTPSLFDPAMTVYYKSKPTTKD